MKVKAPSLSFVICPSSGLALVMCTDLLGSFGISVFAANAFSFFLPATGLMPRRIDYPLTSAGEGFPCRERSSVLGTEFGNGWLVRSGVTVALDDRRRPVLPST